MGFLALLFIFIQPTQALEGTYVYRGNMNVPYHNISFGPIKSLTHLGQDETSLKYQAEQAVKIDGHTVSPVVYTETPDSVKISVGDPASSEYHEFAVLQNGVRELAIPSRQNSGKNVLAAVKVKN